MSLIKSKIETLYKEYLVLEEFVEVKTKETKNIDGITDLDEIEKVVTERYVDLSLYSRDSQIVFFDLICLIELFKESTPLDKLPDNIEDFFKNKRDLKPKRLSIPFPDRVEIPEEILALERDKFLNSIMYNNIKKQIESSLN